MPDPAMPASNTAPATPSGTVSPEEATSQITALIPEPEEPYSYKLLCKVGEAIDVALAKVLGPHAGQAFPETPHPDKSVKGDEVPGKLPATLVIPMALLADAAVSFGGEGAQKYAIDIPSLTTNDALDTVLAQLRTMATDKKLIKAIAEQAGGGEKPVAKAPEKKAPPSDVAIPEDAAAYM